MAAHLPRKVQGAGVLRGGGYRVLLTGGIVVTMDPRRRVFPAGAVAVEGGVIREVGPAAALAERWSSLPVVDVRGLVVLPGLVNAHVHLTGPSLFPGIEPGDSPLPDHMPRYVLPAHLHAEPADERAAARYGALQLLRAGTSAFIEAGVLRYPDAVLDGLAAMGVRGSVGAWVSDRWPLPFAATDPAVALSLGRGRVEVWPDVVGHDGCSDELYLAAARLAQRRWTFHMSAFPDDGAWFRERTGRAPLVHLDALGVLDERAVIAHGIHLSDDEVAVLHRTGATVAFCPQTALRLATGVTRVGRHPELDRVALGTDTVNASNHYDLLRTAAIAADLYGEVRGDRAALTAQRVLEWLTLGGADALGRRDALGSLEAGKRADIAVFDAGQPIRNVENALVHGSARAVHVFVDGERLLADGHVDGEEAIVADAIAAAERVAGRAGFPAATGWLAG